VTISNPPTRQVPHSRRTLFKRLAATAAALSVAAAVLAGGCNRGTGSTPAGGKQVKVAFVTNNASEYWKLASNGVKKYEGEGKIQVDIKMPPTGKPEEQNQILETLVSQGYDAIAVSVIAPKDQLAALNGIAGKTKLITVDSDADQSARLVYVGSLNYDAGKLLGEQIVKLLPSGGKVAVFVGTFAADNAAQRLKGIEDAVKGKNIEVIRGQEDQTDRAKARGNVEAVLNNTSLKVDLVCGLWSYNGPAIAAALEGTGKAGKVLAAVFDDEDGTLKGVGAGTIQCTVVQHPYDMGYRSAKWMHKLATEGDAAKATIPASKIDDTGLEVIRKENLAEYEKRLAEWKK
jgi:ribose transport system substrate-binding protein